MRYALVQAEQAENDVAVQVDGFDLLIDEQIIDKQFEELTIGYSEAKGYLLSLGNKTFSHKTIVTRKPRTGVASSSGAACEVKVSSCSKGA